MGTFVLSIVIIVLAMAGVGIGVMFGKQPLKGSCGSVCKVKGAQCLGCSKGNAS